MLNRNSLRKRYRKGSRQCHRWNRVVEPFYEQREPSKRDIGRAGTTRVPCSCFMCGNPRRIYKGKDALTVLERRALLYSIE